MDVEILSEALPSASTGVDTQLVRVLNRFLTYVHVSDHRLNFSYPDLTNISYTK